MSKINLVIVASGLGSRLSPQTDHIPKFLINIGKNTGYVEMIRYWDRLLDLGAAESTLTVITHSSYKTLVQEYHDLYFPKINIRIKTVDEAKGSAHAIDSSCEHLNEKSVLFTWCDVLPVDDIDLSALGNNQGVIGKKFCTIFTNYNNSNRYGVEYQFETKNVKPFIDKKERGGCFGLYHVPYFKTKNESGYIQYQDGQDFIEVLEQFGDIREQRIDNIIDFGDKPKLLRTRSNADSAREFNSIKFIEDFVFKEAINEQGFNIIEKEINWYSWLDKLIQMREVIERPSTPRIWFSEDKKSFFMTRVKGVPIVEAWPQLSEVDRHYVLSQLIYQQKKIFNLGVEHNIEPSCEYSQKTDSSRLLCDVEIESRTKLINRYNEIRKVISAFGKISTVNDYKLKIDDPLITIGLLSEAILDYYRTNIGIPYGFIHGDLQFSNSLVDLNTMKVSIIDPRGYFGKTLGAGLEDYDTGKLLYALSGYDTFNSSNTFHLKTLKDGHIDFCIEVPSHKGVEELIDNHFRPIHHLWCAVNFIGLAQYIKNDPIKSLAAHYHGLMLAERALGL